MRALTISLLFLFLATAASAQQPGATAKLEELERKLDEATWQLEQAGSVIRLVREEISRLKGEAFNSSNARADQRPGATKQAAPENPKAAFIERIIDPELGLDERKKMLDAKPEIFIQTRYSALTSAQPLSVPTSAQPPVRGDSRSASYLKGILVRAAKLCEPH